MTKPAKTSAAEVLQMHIDELEAQKAKIEKELSRCYRLQDEFEGKALAHNRTAKELIYEYLTRHKKQATLAAIIDFYYKDSKGEERGKLMGNFQTGISTLLRRKVIKKIPAKPGKRGHLYELT